MNFGEEARSQLYAVTDYLARRGNDQVLIPFRKSGWEFQQSGTDVQYVECLNLLQEVGVGIPKVYPVWDGLGGLNPIHRT